MTAAICISALTGSAGSATEHPTDADLAQSAEHADLRLGAWMWQEPTAPA